ncbi:hypothetical protein BAY1663_05100 [Pseudomonas sp. BAY1663]|nr:hypothetical protein BAY1663_05100 [Pseudomonas sp. BAY1663]
MRRDHAAGWQFDAAAGQQVQRIGIPGLRHLTLRRQRQQAAAPGRLAEAGTDHQHIGAVGQCRKAVGRLDAVAHDLRAPHQRRCDMLRPGRQRHHAGTAAQRRLGSEQRGAAGAEFAADYQHLAEAALVRHRRTRCYPCQGRPVESHGLACDLRDDLWIGLQVVEHQCTDAIRPIRGEQAKLEADEGHAELGTHGLAQHPPGIGAEAGGRSIANTGRPLSLIAAMAPA